VTHREHLQDALQGWLAGQVSGWHAGEVKPHRAEVAAWLAAGSPVAGWVATGAWDALLAAWVKGLPVDWSQVHGGRLPERLSLPTYPFECARYWAGRSPARASSAKTTTAASPSMASPSPSRDAAPSVAPLPRPIVLNTPAARQHSAVAQRSRSIVALAPIPLPVADPQPMTATKGAHVMTFDVSTPSDASILAVRNTLATSLADLLAIPVDNLGGDDHLSELGLDSIMTAEWARHLSRVFGVPLKATKIYDYPTLGRLAVHIASLIGELPMPPEPSPTHTAQPSETTAPTAIETSLTVQALKESLAGVLGLDAAMIGLDDKFTELGLDSIIAAEWTRALNASFALRLKATAVYDHPTLRQLAPALANAPRVPGLPAAPLVSALEVRVAPAAIPAAQSAQADEVVSWSEVSPGVVRVVLRDTNSKNACTDELIHGLHLAFAAIEQEPSWKVVILTGYDGYFATGGTRAGLIAIQEGKVDYNSTPFFRLPIDCSLPVIAAMQGHALGAGWVLGMGCDFPIISAESFYSTNFMTFGFTPGVGSTLIFPEKFGRVLAQELLFTGKRYRGSELADKGVAFPVLPRAQVEAHAMELACSMAEAPREALVELKRHMAAPLRQGLAATIEQELQMHSRTFVNNPHVRERIEHMLEGDHSVTAASAAVAKVTVAGMPASTAPAATTPITAAPIATAPTPASTAEGFAIVGLSLRLPGSTTIAEFWSHVVEGHSLVTEVPLSRWDWRDHATLDDAGASLRWGAFIEGLDDFEPRFFGVSPRDAEQLPCTHRLLMNQVWAALEDAAITPAQFAQIPTGVFLALGPAEDGVADANSLVPSMLPNRISYALDLRGPSEYCESGCASFALALHRATRAIAAGECEQAIVGAVHILSSPASCIGIGAMGLLSADGHSRSFQQQAAGYVRSEGVGAVIIKPLSNAVAAGDSIYAVVRGTAVVHGGSGMSLTTPSASGMKQAAARALRMAGVDPSSVAYIEAHGTASGMSDAIEANALVEGYAECSRAWQAATGRINAVSGTIGSLKPCLGHGEIVSGFSALAKVVSAMHARVLPGISGFATINEEIDLGDGRFSLQAEHRPWPAMSGPLRAAINSYGYSGINAHVVLESFERPSVPAGNDGEQILLLSAYSPERLRAVAARLLTHLSRRDSPVHRLADVAHTLRHGRVAMDIRAAWIASDIQGFADQLRAFVHADQAPQLPIAGHPLLAPTKRWLTGEEVDWSKHDPRPAGSRIALPTYPFPSFPRHDARSLQQRAPNAIEIASAREFVAQVLAVELKMDAAGITDGRDLRYYGVDSRTLTLLARALEERFGLHAGMRALMELRTIDALASWIASEAACTATMKTAPGVSQEQKRAPDPDIVAAIKGMRRGELRLDEINDLVVQKLGMQTD
jgi:acyl transferase domain-containing protein/enoyl-CoA hydratase/carnithine racemase